MLDRYTIRQGEKCRQLNREKYKQKKVISMELTLSKVGRLARPLTVWYASRKKAGLHTSCDLKTKWLKLAKIQARSLSEWSQVNYSR